MKITNAKNQREKNKARSIVAGVAGAVAIAGVTVAATMALKNEKNRKKAKKAIINVKDQARDYIDTFKNEQKITKKSGTIKKVTKKDTKKIEEKK